MTKTKENQKLKRELRELRETLYATRQLVVRGALVGFNPLDKKDPTWCTDLYANNGRLTSDIAKIDELLEIET